MNKVFRRLSIFLLPVILLVVALLLAWRNYTPNTYLIGWDSLHPEFNFNLAFGRAFEGVWREEQGVGAISAHSSMSDIPRIILLWLSSFVLPNNFLRYLWFFLMLVIGPLGIYFFILKSFKQDILNTRLASFLGGVFYLLNLGTVQHFFVPFEMFATAFGFLPWIFLTASNYLILGGRKRLIVLFLIILISSPMAYAATLFYANYFALAIFLLFLILFSDKKRVYIKRYIFILIVILSINLYWLLPNLYSIIKQSNIIVSSHINELFSPEAFLRNKEYGTFGNLIIQKNFLFSWSKFDFQKNGFVDLMSVWKNFLQKINLMALYLPATLAVLGCIIAIFKKNMKAIVLLPVLFLGVFFLINENLPFDKIYLFLRQNSPIFDEGLRMPFTKFSIIFMLAISFYFGHFWELIFSFFQKNKISKILPVLLTMTMLAFLVSLNLPSFQGNLISPSMKVKIPTEYFQLYDWFNNHDDGRIAKFPIYTHWGWEFNDWGYEGSGFLSFGIKNPILTRDFDRWSPYNESFYNEASFALYNQDKDTLERVLQKYQVRYLLLDESIINAGADSKLLYIPEIKKIISTSSHVQEVARFGFLTVYKTNFDDTNKTFFSTPQNYTKIETNLTYSQIDPIYERYGTYIQDKKGISFPFVNFDKRGDIEVQSKDNGIEINNTTKNTKVSISNQPSISESFDADRGFPNGKNCDIKNAGKIYKTRFGEGISYKAENDGVSCDFFTYDLSYKQGYILRIKGENLYGRSLKFYLQNWITGKMDLEELLPEGKFDEYYFILPKSIDGEGYTLNLETRSFGRIASENIVNTIEFYPLDIDILTSLHSDIESNMYSESKLKILNVSKFSTTLYKVRTEGSGLLMFGQGYEDGWIAFSNRKLLQHTKVNSWANGWLLDDTESIVYIIYWPQILEYLGFLVLILSILLILRLLIIAKPVVDN